MYKSNRPIRIVTRTLTISVRLLKYKAKIRQGVDRLKLHIDRSTHPWYYLHKRTR